MAEGRTIAAKELTKLDREVLRLCEVVAEALRALIPNPDNAKEFWAKYGKINYSRDAGLGVVAASCNATRSARAGDKASCPFPIATSDGIRSPPPKTPPRISKKSKLNSMRRINPCDFAHRESSRSGHPKPSTIFRQRIASQIKREPR